MARPGAICIECLSNNCHHLTGVPPFLSAPEVAIIRMMGKGQQTKYIAWSLDLNEAVVNSRLGAIYRKLGFGAGSPSAFAPRVQLALWARDHADLLAPAA